MPQMRRPATPRAAMRRQLHLPGSGIDEKKLEKFVVAANDHDNESGDQNDHDEHNQDI